ncbi:MAG: serine/threonine protein kinase, partial [Myxococcales bacterium]|nr:serine/threonine protein kinase [Myxococcales bacterium]
MSERIPGNDSLIGAHVDGGRYEIVKLIGEGGMGRVFQARQVSMNRMVALKILRAQLAGDEQLLARFQQEALSVSRLRHPNTITIFDYGRTEDGYLFMAMELLGGRSLYTILREEGPLPLPRALHMMEQVCGSVHEAHQLGIVHRDLKPENIQIDKVGNDPDFAKVLDFGIAKIIHGDSDEEKGGKTLTMAGAIFGTPHYMSPEQVHGHKIDHRTDIYSLGIILYELLTGQPPFDGTTPMSVMMAQASRPPPDIREAAPDADVTDSVAELIAHCLRKDRDERLQDASTLITRLQQVQYELGEITSTNARLFMDASVREAAQRSSAAARKEARSRSGEHEIDTRSAPEHSGQLATMPPTGPGLTGDFPPQRGGAGKWVAAGLLVAALGGGAFYWQSRDTAHTAAASGGGDEATGGSPERIVIDSRAREIVYAVSSKPAGASVLSGDEVLGETPLDITVLENERRTFSLRLDGHQPAELTLEGAGDARQARAVELKPKPVEPAPVDAPATAWLALRSQPAGAEVYLGADMLGVTPFDWKPPASEEAVTLRFVLDGHRATQEKVQLAATK